MSFCREKGPECVWTLRRLLKIATQPRAVRDVGEPLQKGRLWDFCKFLPLLCPVFLLLNSRLLLPFPCLSCHKTCFVFDFYCPPSVFCEQYLFSARRPWEARLRSRRLAPSALFQPQLLYQDTNLNQWSWFLSQMQRSLTRESTHRTLPCAASLGIWRTSHSLRKISSWRPRGRVSWLKWGWGARELGVSWTHVSRWYHLLHSHAHAHAHAHKPTSARPRAYTHTHKHTHYTFTPSIYLTRHSIQVSF